MGRSEGMRVSILSLARRDLKEARDYLSELGVGPAKTFRASFEKFVGQITDMPYMFSVCEYSPKYRRAVVAYDYLVFYTVDKTGSIIKIHRVLHGKRNIADVLHESANPTKV